MAPSQSHHEHDQPGLSQLLQSLVDDTRRLVRDEIDLARTELQDNARRALRETIILALGAGLTVIAFGALMASITFGLAQALTPLVGHAAALWLSPLIVCLASAFTGAVLIRRAVLRLKSQSLAPRRAMESVRDSARSVIDRLQ